MDLMLQRRVTAAGTMNAYPLGLAAIQATISIYEKGNGAIYKQVDKVQRRLMDGMKETAKRHNFPMYIQGPTGVFVAPLHG